MSCSAGLNMKKVNNLEASLQNFDKIAIFVYIGKNFIQVRALESNIPLKNIFI